MFSSLFGKKEADMPGHLFTDRAYMTTIAKMHACIELAEKDKSYLFIAWFKDTATEFRKYFLEHGAPESMVIEVKEFHTSRLVNHKPVFVEHYPLHTAEEALVKDWKQEKIIVYSALDEPLFKHFGSEKIIPMMKLMGMKENEVIEHNMVTKSIIKGQHKIEEQVTVEQSANLQEDWMKRNLG